MDLFSLVQIIKNHPDCKNQGDALRSCLLSSQKAGFFDFEDFRRLVSEFSPDIWNHLGGNRGLYRKIQSETLGLRCRGFQFVCYGEPLYPADFYLMPDPPLSFSFLGAPAWTLGRSLSVVGSRDPREDSLLWMENELGDFLNQERVHLVSGGARGVDQKAHALALRRNLPTTVVLPSGLGEIYPSTLEKWTKTVLENGGCFLSEYAFLQPMRKHLFHHRNRLIAALGKMILLVEARRRSGSLISAHQAAQAGRPVLVVPGHPQDKNFSGSLDLLADGAHLVRDAQDLTMFYRSELWAYPGSTTGLEAFETREH